MRADLDQAILNLLAPGERVRPAQLLMIEKYSPVDSASGSSLTASQAWVIWALLMSSGAFGPPMRVGTQPGSSALERTAGQRRATAKARSTSCSLLSA